MYGDKSPLVPNGIRIGTSCITTRKITKDGLNKIADWLFRCVIIANIRQDKFGVYLKDWGRDLNNDPKLVEIRKEVVEYSRKLEFY